MIPSGSTKAPKHTICPFSQPENPPGILTCVYSGPENLPDNITCVYAEPEKTPDTVNCAYPDPENIQNFLPEQFLFPKSQNTSDPEPNIC